MIITVTLKEYTTSYSSQKQAAIDLKLTQPAISRALKRKADVWVSFDTISKEITNCYKISPFGRFAKNN